MKKSPAKRTLSLLLTLLLLLPLAQAPVQAQGPALLNLALISDIHYFPETMAGGYGPVFEAGQILGHPIEQTPGLLRSALAAIKARALRGELDYLLIPGDLTREGEKGAHEGLRDILLQFENEAKIPVAVIPGNHDIYNGGAADFSSGEKKGADSVSPAEFFALYADLGYDLPGLARYTTDLDAEGALSYAADLNGNYRLVALDTWRRRVSPELRAWAEAQCEQAVADGKTVVAMGHHNLNEQLKGQLVVMQNEGIENMREVSEAFAGAGMHFYFSGHLHMSEISPWYSDKGEALYDIIVPGLYSFPGGYRVVNFSTEGKQINADVQSYAPDEVTPVVSNNIEYTPYYPAALEYSFGYKGEGLAGFAKAAVQNGLRGPLEDLRRNGGIAALVRNQADLGPLNALFEYLDERLVNQPDKLLGLVGGLVDDAFALPVSKLPCTRFIEELGFGDKNKPGTLGDMGLSAIVYMFWKKHDPQADPFLLDVLRRMKNGELLDQLLSFAVPKVLEVLGEGVLPLIVDCGPVAGALAAALNGLGCPLLTMPILALAVTPEMRGAVSATLYGLASNIITSSSPSGRGTDAKLVYGGPVETPTANAFRLPYDIRVSLGGDKKSAEVTWYTKASLASPDLKLTDAAGVAASGVSISCDTQFEDITVNVIDLGIAQMMGTNMRAARHTARLEGLAPGKAYKFTVGDSEFNWYSEPQNLPPEEDSPFLAFFRRVWEWMLGMWKLFGIWWSNRGY
ncbi:MAG: metallophosphoesterase [Oscillospiraceae bacterium]|jgi:3',5'-cyclic AMP phosphodiesterase CpdA|nr:metallophosphoesterase [Oscillospiraceae bacterium]